MDMCMGWGKHSKFRQFTCLPWFLLSTGFFLISSLHNALTAAWGICVCLEPSLVFPGIYMQTLKLPGIWVSFDWFTMAIPYPTLLVKFLTNMPVYCLPQPEVQPQASYDVYTLCVFTTEIDTLSEKHVVFHVLLHQVSLFNSEVLGFHGLSCSGRTIVPIQFGKGKRVEVVHLQHHLSLNACCLIIIFNVAPFTTKSIQFQEYNLHLLIYSESK